MKKLFATILAPVDRADRILRRQRRPDYAPLPESVVELELEALKRIRLWPSLDFTLPKQV